ncbi:MAG: FADH(2)-oxidizing methylenetetrahydrofolate--tRNA-(uracil(54)-C(5))-methyltransferase TrmFO, partial [Hyphomicrobiales bacterium]|nr:FADH(2)-oxidizing methylenetetrahydrofolate--tRNA-(uracil(54)-C(5))-methyltransferase TrmFO [Hyphomicrobiales bacterium]
LGAAPAVPPATTAIGALINHITAGHLATIDAGPRSFQPMNVNFGLFPPIETATHDADGRKLRGPDKGVARKMALSERAGQDLAAWLATSEPARPAPHP